MAKFIAEQDIDEDICKNENGKLCNDEGTNCIECIKEHFKQEIRNESQNSFENARCCICGNKIKWRINSMDNFKVFHKKDILIKVLEPKETTSESGIILDLHPSFIDDRNIKGEVVQVGKKVTEVKVGDTVVVLKHAGVDLYKKDDYRYTLVSFDKVLGIINN